MKKYDVIVIGAGASGLLAAGAAAEQGAKTLLQEKMDLPAIKLSISGKGRCNLTNKAELTEFMEHIGPDNRFLRSGFSQFFNDDLIDLIHQQGLQTVIERGERVFPKCQSAKKVVEALVQWVQSLGVTIRTSYPTTELWIEDSIIRGIKVNKLKIPGKSVIICCGGQTYPLTGSTGDGYQFAKQAGHTVHAPHPALVPLVTQGDLAPKMQGLSLKNVQGALWVNGKKLKEEFGEMLFTHYGLSGPIVLSLTRHLPWPLPKSLEFKLDLKPALDHKKLDLRLQREIQEHHKKKIKTWLKNLLPAKMIDTCCACNGLPPEAEVHTITAQQRKNLRNWLKEISFKVIRTRGNKEAIVTRGGVELKEITPKTMESKKLKGLFFAGEVLNLDADTGGYNLQIAFTTGHIAGQNAAWKAMEE